MLRFLVDPVYSASVRCRNILPSLDNCRKTRSERSARGRGARNGIEIQGEGCPKPITSFKDLNLPPELQQYLVDNGYISPTAIQMQALSCVMSGRDIIGLAETGSGKTLAYSLPLCMFLKTRKPCLPGEGPVVLILTPTRELMRQVSDHVSGLLNYIMIGASEKTSDAFCSNAQSCSTDHLKYLNMAGTNHMATYLPYNFLNRGIQNMMCNKVIGKQTQYNTNGILIALPVMSQD